MYFRKYINLITKNSYCISIHSESRTLKPSTSHSFVCDYCNQTFSRKQNLKCNLLVHVSTFDDSCKIVSMYCIANGISKKFVTRKKKKINIV